MESTYTVVSNRFLEIETVIADPTATLTDWPLWVPIFSL